MIRAKIEQYHFMSRNQFHAIDVLVQFIGLIWFHQIYVLISSGPISGPAEVLR